MSDKLLTKRTRYASYHAEEIIVALPHLHQVQHVLRLVGVTSTVLDTSQALDLARLRVPEPEGGLRLPARKPSPRRRPPTRPR